MMASSQTQLHNTFKNRNRNTLTIFLFLLIFVSSIFLFSKRALEPTLLFYSDPNPQKPLVSSSQDPDTTVENVAREEEEVRTEPVQDTNSGKEDGLKENDPTEEAIPVSKNDSLVDLGDGKSKLKESGNEEGKDGDGNFATDEFDDGSKTGVDEVKQQPDPKTEANFEGKVEEEEVGLGQMCDLYKGKWVRDEEYPIYKPGTCPYVDEAFDCQDNGRPDSDYLKWRWQPDGCELPR